MKSLSLLINLLVLFLAISCQVKETSTSGLVSGHNSTTNAFTIVTPSAYTFQTTEIISISLSFPFNVTVTGTPQVELTIGATTRYADYVSGDGTKILVFEYIVGNDTDTNGITVEGLGLNGGTLEFDNAGVMTACSTSLSAKTFANVKVTNTNEFTIVTPAAHNFAAAETLSINLTFPFNVTVTGTPQIDLNIGGSAVTADYTSGDGTTTLTFEYVIQPADNDSNGISVTGLSLNGGTLEFDNNGTPTSCNTTIATPTWATVIVDTSAPTITAFALTNSAGFYHKSQNISFTMTFSEAVTVTGTPRFAVAFTTGGTVYADYASGSGSTILTFSYSIQNSVADTNGYGITSPIDLNGGTILDASGNASSLTFAAFTAAVITASANVDLDGRVPYVTSVTPPADATYIAGQNLDFTVNYDRAVNVTGAPYISLTIGSTTVQAIYNSGSGTSAIVYRYLVVPGDVDANGVALATTITQNGATTTGASAPTSSYFSVALNNSFTSPVSTGVIVNALQPQPTSVTRGSDTTLPTFGTAVADNVWNIGQTLFITVGFNTTMVVSQTGGTPRIPLTIGASTQYATYLSGSGGTSLIFQYVVQEGDLDSDGSVAIGSIQLNGGTIMDSNGTNSTLTLTTGSLTTTTIDGVRPVISSVSKPADGTYSTITGNNHLIMTFTVTWAEAVNYSTTVLNVPLTIGATSVNAAYASGNNSTAIIHRASSLATYNDTDGIVASSPLTGTAVVKDRAGNTATDLTYTPPTMTSVKVDTTAPTVSSVTSPTAGSYTAGSNLDFIVNFSEIVNITSSGGYPRIALVMDSGTKYATYLSGTGTSAITFRYTVVAADLDTNGITNPTALSITNAPTAYARDLGWNGNTTTSYVISTNLTGVVVDGLYPTVSSRSAPANGTYDAGDTISFTVTYSEAVTVTGTPRIQVAAQTGTLNFNYASGSGTTVITFSYLVTSSDFDLDGLSSSITTISLNGGTMKDANNNVADTTFTTLSLASVYLAYPNMTVWTTSSFTNQAAIAGITVSSSGAVTSAACGTGTCRVFNGDDALNISGAVNGVETAFIVFKNPAVLANVDVLGSDLSLTDDTAAFDMSTVDATLDLDGSPYSGTVHDTSMSTSSTHILQADYTVAQNYGAGPIVDTPFLGAIGEVILVTGTLTAPQKAQVLIYLNAKY